MRKRPMAGRKLRARRTVSLGDLRFRASEADARLDGRAVGIQQVLDLARVLTNGIQSVALLGIGRVVVEGVGLPNAVAGASSHLCHLELVRLRGVSIDQTGCLI